jgi:hypothetical protein
VRNLVGTRVKIQYYGVPWNDKEGVIYSQAGDLYFVKTEEYDEVHDEFIVLGLYKSEFVEI